MKRGKGGGEISCFALKKCFSKYDIITQLESFLKEEWQKQKQERQEQEERKERRSLNT